MEAIVQKTGHASKLIRRFIAIILVGLAIVSLFWPSVIAVGGTMRKDLKAEIDSLTPQYVARIGAWKGSVSPECRQELSNMSGFVDMGVRCGMFTKDDALFKAVKSALSATRASVKRY